MSKPKKEPKPRLHRWQQVAGGPGWKGFICGRCGVCKREGDGTTEHALTWGGAWLEGAPAATCEDP